MQHTNPNTVDGINRKIRRKQTGEDFTPTPLVNEVLDQLEISDPDIFSDPNRTFFDPACGNGQFLLGVKERLMSGLRYIFPNDNQREQYILLNQLYGIDIMRDNVVSCCERLGYEEAGLPIKRKARIAVSNNILCANTLEHDTPEKIKALYKRARISLKRGH